MLSGTGDLDGRNDICGGQPVKRDLAYVVHSDLVIAQRVSEAMRQSDFEVSSMTTLEDAEYVIRERQFDLPDAILTPLGDLESGDSVLIALFQSNPLMEQIPLVVVASSEKEERRGPSGSVC